MVKRRRTGVPEGSFSRLETQRNNREITSGDNADVVASYSPSILSFVAKNVLYPVNTHASYEFFYVTQGTGIVYLAGHALRVREGDLVFAGDGVAHGYAMERGSVALMTGANLTTTREFVAYAHQRGLDHLVLRDVPVDSALSNALWYMAENQERMKEGVHLAGRLGAVLDRVAEIVELHGYVCDHLPPTQLDAFAAVAYSSTVRHRLSAADAARELGVSPTYFSRTFARLLGMSYPTYCALGFVNGARRMLAQTELSVNKIAAICGYDSLRSFNRQFRAISGVTPTEYRERQAPSQVVDFGMAEHEEELRACFERLLETRPSCPYVTLSPGRGRA